MDNTKPRFVFVTVENTKTAAFINVGRNDEIRRILSEAADRILAHGFGHDGFDLQDIDGNVIGRCVLSTDDMIEPLVLPPGGIRVGLDLSSPAFDEGIGREVDIAAALSIAAEKFDALGAATHFLLRDRDGVYMGAVGQTLSDSAPHVAADVIALADLATSGCDLLPSERSAIASELRRLDSENTSLRKELEHAKRARHWNEVLRECLDDAGRDPAFREALLPYFQRISEILQVPRSEPEEPAMEP